MVGDGTQTRDFLFGSDVAQAFYLAAKTEISGEVYNLGAGNPQSVNRLVELIGGEKGLQRCLRRMRTKAVVSVIALRKTIDVLAHVTVVDVEDAQPAQGDWIDIE